jgi:hypothetical protein
MRSQQYSQSNKSVTGLSRLIRTYAFSQVRGSGEYATELYRNTEREQTQPLTKKLAKPLVGAAATKLRLCRAGLAASA